MLQSLLEAAAGFLSSLCTLKECAVVQLLARSGPWHAVMGPATLPSERPAERARARRPSAAVWTSLRGQQRPRNWITVS